MTGRTLTCNRHSASEKLGAAASRIYDGAPGHQSELSHVSWKDDGEVTDRSTLYLF